MTEKDRLQRQQHVALSGLFVNTSSCQGFSGSWHLTSTIQPTAVRGNTGHQIFLVQWITPSIQPTAVSGNTGYQITSTIRSTVVKGNMLSKHIHYLVNQITSTIQAVGRNTSHQITSKSQMHCPRYKLFFCQKRTGRKSSWINWQCRH